MVIYTCKEEVTMLDQMIKQAQLEWEVVKDSDDKELQAFYRGRLSALEELKRTLPSEN